MENIYHKSLTKNCILSFEQSSSALSVLLHFTLKDVFNRRHSFEI